MEKNPHPDRDNSSKSYYTIGEKFFKDCEVNYIGSLERFERLLPNGKFKLFFKKHSYKLEKYIPNYINMKIARAQIVDYKFPLKSKIQD